MIRLPRTGPAAWAERGALALLALLVFGTVVVVAAAPRAVTAGSDDALRATITERTRIASDLTYTGRPRAFGAAPADLGTVAGLDPIGRRLRAGVPPDVAAVLARDGHEVWARAQGEDVVARRTGRHRGGQRLTLQWRPQAMERLRYVSGHAPGTGADTDDGQLVEAVMARASARELDVRAGDELVTSAGRTVRITGIYAPAGTGPYWGEHPSLRSVNIYDGGFITEAAVLLSEDAYRRVAADATGSGDWPFTHGWSFRIDAAALSTDKVAALDVALSRMDGRGLVPAGGLLLDFDTGLDRQLRDFAARLGAAQAVLAIALAGLFVAAAGVLGLGAWLTARRFAGPVALMLARGAGRGTSFAGVAAVTGLVAAPAATLGYVAAVLAVPGRGSPASLAAAAGAALVAGLGPALMAQPRGLERRRRARLASVLPLVLEAALPLLAVAGVYLLLRRGLAPAEAGADPFLAAVPVLAGMAVGVLTLRLYPYLVRAALAMAARARGAVPFAGLARASRTGLAAAVPVLVLVPAMAVAGLGAGVGASLAQAQNDAAWRKVGAAARVDADRPAPGAERRIRSVPGVTGSVRALVASDAVLSGGGIGIDTVTLVALDLGAYRKLLAGSPLSVPDPGKAEPGTVPALVTPDVAAHRPSGRAEVAWGAGRPVPVTVAGVARNLAGLPSRAVLVPRGALKAGEGALITTVFFVSGTDLGTGALGEAAGGGAHATTLAQARAGIGGGPLGRTVQDGFRALVIATAVLAALSVLLALATGAAARGAVVSALRTLGLSRRQAGGLLVLEAVPPVVAAVVTGGATGLALPWLVGPALDLRGYTGGETVTRFTPDLVAAGVLAAVLVALTLVAVAVETVRSRRRGLGDVLRAGAGYDGQAAPAVGGGGRPG